MTNNYDTLQIDTPENVTFDYDISGIGSRFLAAFLDAILLSLLEGIVLGTLIWLFAKFQDILSEDAQMWIIGALLLIGFLFFWGYSIFFEILWNGQTPGKRIVGVRVIRLDGTPVAATEILIRNLIRIVDFLPFAYGVGVVAMFANQNARRLGDLAAGTVVVHDRKPKDLKDMLSVRVQSLDENAVIHSIGDFPALKMDSRDLRIVDDFLARRASLSNRSTLASHLLRSLMEKYQIARESIDHSNPEYALESIHAMFQSRNVE